MQMGAGAALELAGCGWTMAGGARAEGSSPVPAWSPSREPGRGAQGAAGEPGQRAKGRGGRAWPGPPSLPAQGSLLTCSVKMPSSVFTS